MKLIAWLNKECLPHGLALFRILFGIIILWDLNRMRETKLIESLYQHDQIFRYDFLPLDLPDESNLKLLLGFLTIFAVFITIGVLYRWAMAAFAIGFTYFFLLDPVLYNNHLYLVCLLSFLMIFVPADAAFTLQKSRKRKTVPQWAYRLLQFQIFVVFFFGGVVKLNPYWMDFHPMTEALNAAVKRTGNSWIAADWIKYLFTYGGILFDLSIGFLLLIPKTRVFAMVAAVLFSLTNSYIFNDIFIFPFLMIAALLLFANQEKVTAFCSKRKLLAAVTSEKTSTKLGKIGLFGIALFVLIQLLLPLRHYFYEGYTDWTGEGQRFAWRMKIQHRTIDEAQFSIYDLDNKVIHNVDPRTVLHPDEFQQMCGSPQMILQFAHHLKDQIAPKMNIKNCWVKSKIKVSFNGSPAAYIFDPELDLIAADKKYAHVRDWINPLPKKK